MNGDSGSALRLFEAAPGVHLVVREVEGSCHVVGVSDDYVRSARRPREDIVGRKLSAVHESPELLAGVQRAFAERSVVHSGNFTFTPIAELDCVVCTIDGPRELLRYRTLIDTLTALVWRVDGSGATATPLAGWEEFTGQSFEEYRGTGWLNVVHPGDRVRAQREWQEAVDAGRALALEFRARRRDGEIRNLVSRGVPLRDETGRITEWVGTCTDVTAERRGEQRLRGVLDSLFAFVGVMTPDGILIEANLAPIEAAGIRKEDVIGKRFEDAYWWSYSEAVQEQLRDAIRAAQHGISSRYDVDVRMRGGELLSIDFMLAPMFDADGNIEYLIPSAVDIHERKRTERALRQSEEQLRMTVEVARVCSWIVDLETMEVTWSPEVYEIYGLPDDAEPSHELWRSAVVAEDLERVETAIADTLAGHRDFAEEFRIVRDGETRWLLGKGHLVSEGEGRKKRFLGVNIDVTERRRAEEELARQLRLNRAITDNATTALFIMDARQHCVYLNPAGEELTGYKLAELQGKPLHEFVHYLHPDGSPYPIEDCPIDRALPEKNQTSGEDVFIHKNGSFYPVAFTASPIREADGFVGTVIEVQGIAARKRMEAALLENEERFRTLADNISQFAWMADASGSLFWYNRRWYEYTGTTFEQMQGWGWRSVHHPEHLARVEALFRECVESGSPWEDTFPLRGKDGQYRWFLSRALPIRDEKGHVIRWFGTNTDVDEQKRTEARLRRANQDLEQFAFSASHDLQEPLRNVAIYSQLLQRRYEGQLDEQADEYLRVLIEGALRMRSLVSDLLVYTEAGHVDDGPPPGAEAEAILAEVLLQMQGPLEECGAIVTHDPLPALAVRPVHLQQLLSNLIGNAVKYRRYGEPVKIHVSAQRDNAFWRLSVRDNGIGISKEFHTKVFGVFKRLHPKGGKYPGTGIGLAICKKIIDRYGGTIWVESDGRDGSMFHFTLPDIDSPPEGAAG